MNKPEDALKISRRDALKISTAGVTSVPHILNSAVAELVSPVVSDTIASVNSDPVPEKFTALVGQLRSVMNSMYDQRIRLDDILASVGHFFLPRSMRSHRPRWDGSLETSELQSEATQILLDTEKGFRRGKEIAREILAMPEIREVYGEAIQARRVELALGKVRVCTNAQRFTSELESHRIDLRPVQKRTALLKADLLWIDEAFPHLDLEQQHTAIISMGRKISNVAKYLVSAPESKNLRTFLEPFAYYQEGYDRDASTKVKKRFQELGIEDIPGGLFWGDPPCYAFYYHRFGTTFQSLADRPISEECCVTGDTFEFLPFLDDVEIKLPQLQGQSNSIHSMINLGSKILPRKSRASDGESSDVDDKHDLETEDLPSYLQRWYGPFADPTASRF